MVLIGAFGLSALAAIGPAGVVLYAFIAKRWMYL